MRSPRTAFTLLISTTLLWALSALSAASYSGTWMASTRDDQLLFNFRFKDEGQMGLTLPRTAFEGLDAADRSDAKFKLQREAGTIHFEGRFAGGEGAGHYRFEPDDAYLEAMAKLGYSGFSADEHFQLALFDVGPARVKALAQLGYAKLSHEQLIQVAIFRVTPEHILALKAVGYDKLTLDELVASRIHKVTPEHIRQFAELGYRKLSFDDLLATRIHGVTPEFIREIREAGYPDVTLEQLVTMRIHSIDSDYVRSLSKSVRAGKK
ncbi:4-hydroxy-3-methylbut-2-enyl diphosphate reductase [Myxococcaceae bacterium GXIMD 01537]